MQVQKNDIIIFILKRFFENASPCVGRNKMLDEIMTEYDIHKPQMYVDDALSDLERIISHERAAGSGVFAVVTGYGSTGGTSKIKSAVLAACRRYLRQNHIRGYLDGEKAGDMFSPEFLSFPGTEKIPVGYKRSSNPGVVFIAV